MAKQLVEIVTFHCFEEYNDWEGETWYHYFLDEPGVLDILNSIMNLENTDFEDLETITVTWDEATRLTNQDHGEYMQVHWFGKLTNPEGLKKATHQDLYKGGIREFGEELFTYGDDDNNKPEDAQIEESAF